MENSFRCGICNISFSSWREKKKHLTSLEHKKKMQDPLSRSEHLLDMIKKVLKLRDEDGK